MKLMLADDEAYVRRAIVKKLDLKELNIDEVFEADNGEIALDLYIKHRPEIVITDIKMPKLDGLALATKIRNISPDAKIIIISGYDEFEYAQQAVKIFVNDYILKPAKTEVIKAAILKAENEYRSSNVAREKLAQIEFMEMINGRKKGEPFEENARIFVFGFTGRKNNTWDFISEQALIKYGVINVLHEATDELRHLIVEDNNGNVVLLLYTQYSNSELSALAEKLKETVEDAVAVFVSYGISGECNGRELHECYVSALRKMKNPMEKNERYSESVIKAIEYIKENMSKNISLASISSYVHISPTYFSFLFKKETGKNVSKYISDLKLETAKELLSEKKLLVYEVAEKVGFDNPRYFSQFFKKHTKMTVSQFQSLKR